MRRTLALFAGTFVAGLLLDRARLARKARRAAREMIPDHFGNYDLDGVSYDVGQRRVVVGSDGLSRAPKSTRGVPETITDKPA